MRLISKLKELSLAQALSELLTQNGIANELETVTNADWGSENYGETSYFIWAIDEDSYEKALKINDDFLANPHEKKSRFNFSRHKQEEIFNPLLPPNSPNKTPESMGFITRYLLLTCTFLLIAGSFSAPEVKTPPPAYIPETPVFAPPINKELMYDYPKAYEIVDDLINKFGIDSLPPEDPELARTPYWKGVYPKIVNYFRNSPSTIPEAPLFEKIRQGEVWRLFTPCLLHNDLFHLFFNMIWLIVLGKQMEARLLRSRYLIFIFIAAVITNTAQYLMSGPNFLGFSGVLCAMLTFIWFRQKNYPWEGYQLEKGTITFITFFILFMFTLQLISFFLEISSENTLPLAIANTAHLVGAFTGLILARLTYFSWKNYERA